MNTRTRILFFVVAWAIVLMPFLFWRSTWFGRRLSDAEIQAYLHDEQRPRHIQHALVQIGERVGHGDRSAARWYPDLVRLASHPVEEIRNTDAWVMGQDNSRPEFRGALRGLLSDSSPNVRANAALALVRFGDGSGHAEILQMLQTTPIRAPEAGQVTDAAVPGTAIRQGGTIAKLNVGGKTMDIRTPVAGRIRSVSAARGAHIAAGQQVALLDPGVDQVWEALRALYLIGTREDLSAVAPYTSPQSDMPARIREQALLTQGAIRQRSSAISPP